MMAKTFCSLGRSQFVLKEARINEADGVSRDRENEEKKCQEVVFPTHFCLDREMVALFWPILSQF